MKGLTSTLRSAGEQSLFGKGVFMRHLFSFLLISAAISTSAAAELPQADQTQIMTLVDKDAPNLESAALQIWKFAELGYLETRSSGLLQAQLKQAGFTVTAGVAGMPTGFIGSFKSGKGPVIGIIAEFDALPGLSQKASSPVKVAEPGMTAGHGCGHNVFGAASVAAAIAVKRWMVANKVEGEIRLYGTPAEEGGSAKAYFVRDGFFKDVDIALHWHPDDRNSAAQAPSMANISGKFRFYGRSAHAASEPWKGRSALDGVEALDAMVNLMREHILPSTRIHYVITAGGKAPNVVPDFAEVYLYVRDENPDVVRSVMARVQEAAKGAAMGTETRVEWEQTGGVYSMLLNATLMKVMDENLHKVGGVHYTSEERKFAVELSKTLEPGAPSVDTAQTVDDAKIEAGALGSTDVSDVSWVTPTVGLRTAVFIPGSAGHSWQNVAAAGSSIAAKAGVNAAKTLALTAAELFRSPEEVAAAKAEFESKRGKDFVYKAMIGDRKPPLDYRKTT